MKIAHKAVSVVLSLLVMISTLSFTIEAHYCGDRLVDVALFSKVKSCCGNDAHQKVKSSCCKDEIQLVQGQDELAAPTFEDFSSDQELVVTSVVWAYHLLFEQLPKHEIPHQSYKPPNLVADIQLDQQVFLI